MAGGSSSLTFRLFGEDVSASRTLDKVGAEAEGLSAKFGKVGAAAGAAFVGIGVAVGAVAAASVDLAMKFDQSMARIGTMANVPKSQLKGLSDGVLNLAGQVGFSPDSLAKALYMTESSFQSMHIKGFDALDALKTAAQGAAIGGSDLLTTTQAMDAMLASGLVNVTNYKGAMDAMVSTVGTGEMTMQDFVDSLNGVQSVAQAYGVGMADMSAALATFGDNNIRGAQAGTQFRMVIQALAVPAKAGQIALEQMGIGASGLAKDMQEGGLNKAILDLHDHLTKLGIVGPKVGEWITMAFGKRAGVGLTDIYTNLDRFESKYKDVAALMGDKNSLADRWATQQQQFSQQLKDLEYGAEAVGIRFGNFLIPKIMQVGKAVGDAWHAMNVAAGGQGSIFKELAVGFDNKSMTNFDTGFGGALEHVGATIRKLIDTVGSFGQKLGTALLPALKDIGSFITQSLWPALQNLWQVLQGPLSAAVGALVIAFKAGAAILRDVVGPVLTSVTGFLKDNKAAVETLAFAFGALWLEMKGAAALAVVSSAFETVALRAMYVKDALGGVTAMFGTYGVAGGLKNLGVAAAGLAGPMAAAAGAALIVGTTVMDMGKSSAQTSKFIDGLNASLKQAPASVDAYSSAIDQVNSKLDGMNRSMGANSGFFGNIWSSFTGAFTGRSEADVAAVLSGSIDKLKHFRDQLQETQAQIAAKADDIAMHLTDISGGVWADNLATVTNDLKNGIISLGDSWQVAIAKINGANLSLAQSQDAATKAVIDIGSALAQGSKDFTGNTDAALQNRNAIYDAVSAINQHVDAMNRQNKSTEQVAAYTNYMKAALLGQLTQLHQNTPAVRALVDSLLAIPPAKATNVSVPGAANADAIVRSLNRDLANMPDHRTITLSAIDNASSTLSSIRSMIANINPNIPITVSGYANLSKLTSPQFNANGSITAFAGGGFENHVAQFASGMRVWAEPETGGEAYIPLAASKRSRSLAIWQETGRRLGADSGSMHITIQTLDSRSFDQYLSQPGVTEKIANALSKARARGGALAAF